MLIEYLKFNFFTIILFFISGYFAFSYFYLNKWCMDDRRKSNDSVKKYSQLVKSKKYILLFHFPVFTTLWLITSTLSYITGNLDIELTFPRYYLLYLLVFYIYKNRNKEKAH